MDQNLHANVEGFCTFSGICYTTIVCHKSLNAYKHIATPHVKSVTIKVNIIDKLIVHLMFSYVRMYVYAAV